MHLFNQCSLPVATLLLSTLAWPDCLPVEEARKHVGEIKCITGKVVRVKQGTRGVHFLDFCDDFRLCPFTVVVKEYDGRAEIILEEYRQVGGSTARIPPLPKNYDVEKEGRYSAGTFSHPKAGRKASKKRQTAKMPIEVPEDSD